jgi:hypothetical protein
VIAIRPRADQVAHPGERIAIEQPEPGDLISISQERTLPERVHLADAHRVTRDELFALATTDALWVHAVLGELLGVGDTDPKLDDATPAHLIALHRDLSRLVEQEQNVVVHAALVLRRAEVERELAVRNARAADQRVGD